MNTITEALKELTRRFPTTGEQHHCLTYNEETGQMDLGIWVKDVCYGFHLDSEEELYSVNVLSDNIEQLFVCQAIEEGKADDNTVN